MQLYQNKYLKNNLKIWLSAVVLAVVVAGCGPNSGQAIVEADPSELASDGGAQERPDLVGIPLAFEKDYAGLRRASGSPLGSAFPDSSPVGDPVISYKPACKSAACKIWSNFRAQRPFPIQTLAFARSGENSILIITEPNVERSALESSLKDIFGDRVQMEAQRWMVGVDGWLGDMVVTIPADVSPRGGDPLADPVFKDRLSLLAEDLWGTSFGLYLEDAGMSWRSAAAAAAPNLSVNPAELQSWVTDENRKWIDPAGGEARTFAQIADGGGVGTFVSESDELVIFVIEGGALNSGLLDGRHADFRRFAILSDVIAGAVWNDTTGHFALVGRPRQSPPSVLPPLRFETVAMLAAQGADSLSQSYERTLPFAGKLFYGRYDDKDWAPIYLSYDLIDTEYGALLNITDQMLKSWSSAGEIQYVYFDYPLRPRPGSFVFGAKSIVQILNEKTGGNSVLFNWNTAGGAAIVSDNGWSALSPTKSSALPVTYGSELTAGSGMTMGELTREFEEEAYGYYSGLGDPNLSRVVSYATIYQGLRANPKALHIVDGTAPRTAQGVQTQARAKAGVALLTTEVVKTIEAIESGTLPASIVDRVLDMQEDRLRLEIPPQARGTPEAEQVVRDMLAETRGELAAALNEEMGGAAETISAFKLENPLYSDNVQLAALLVDRGRLPTLFAALQKKNDEINGDIDRHNGKYFSSQYEADASAATIKRKQSQFDQTAAALRSMAEDLEKVQSALSGPFSIIADIESIRSSFIEAHNKLNVGWIRTPSIVLSWSEASELSVGGHNLNSRTLRIQPKAGLTRPELEELPTGPVLHVPPSQLNAARANANQLARLVEHGKVDPTILASRLSSFAPSGPIRPPVAALSMAARDGAQPVRLGGAAIRTSAGREAHLAARSEFGNPGLLAERLGDGRIRVSTRVGEKVECCTDIDGYSQFARFAQRTAENGGDVVTVGFPANQVKALEIQLSGGGRKAVSEALGSGGGRGPPPTEGVEVFAGGGKRGGPPGGQGGGGRSGGGSGDGGPTGPSDPRRVSLIVDDANTRATTFAAAKRKIEFGDFEMLDDAGSASIVKEADLPLPSDAKPIAYRISTKDVPNTPSAEAYLIVDAAPTLRETAVPLAQDALGQAMKSTDNLVDLASEAKAIIARSENRSSIRRIWIWAKTSAGAFRLSSLEMIENGQRRG